MKVKGEVHYTIRGRGNFTMPPECNDKAAEFLSTLGLGHSPAERIEDGRKRYARLRELMHREAVEAHAQHAQSRGILKDVSNGQHR